MNKIIINGKEIKCSGSNVTIQNNELIIDGKMISTDIIEESGIRIYGDVNNIECKGSVNCNNVLGDINAGGSVNCDDVGGDVECRGSINCDTIKGNAKAGGSIIM